MFNTTKLENHGFMRSSQEPANSALEPSRPLSLVSRHRGARLSACR